MHNRARIHKFFHDLNQLCKKYDVFLTPRDATGTPLEMRDINLLEPVAVLTEKTDNFEHPIYGLEIVEED